VKTYLKPAAIGALVGLATLAALLFALADPPARPLDVRVHQTHQDPRGEATAIINPTDETIHVQIYYPDHGWQDVWIPAGLEVRLP
jgi:hypothetical protein